MGSKLGVGSAADATDAADKQTGAAEQVSALARSFQSLRWVRRRWHAAPAC